jgi:hypothetical protein
MAIKDRQTVPVKQKVAMMAARVLLNPRMMIFKKQMQAKSMVCVGCCITVFVMQQPLFTI